MLLCWCMLGCRVLKSFKWSFFWTRTYEWYDGEVKTCQLWFSHSNPLPMGSSWAKQIFFKSLYVWDMAPCSYFRLKLALKWKIECQAAIFTVCNPDQSSYTISWTHIRCFWGTNKLFDFFRFPAINCDLSKNLVFFNIAKTEACFTRFLKCRRFFLKFCLKCSLLEFYCVEF